MNKTRIMKKRRVDTRIWSISLNVVVVAVCVFLTVDATADLSLTWVNSPLSNADQTNAVSWVGNDLTLGTPLPQNATQTAFPFGTGAALPTSYNSKGFKISFDWEFNTWDVYSATLGYWDSFSATITKGDYYWNKTLSDPITTDSDIEEVILLVGGTTLNPVLETFAGSVTTFLFNPSDGDQYYLNLMIDNNFDNNYPSWGKFSNVKVTPVPSAVILGFLGLSVAGLKLRKHT